MSYAIVVNLAPPSSRRRRQRRWAARAALSGALVAALALGLAWRVSSAQQAASPEPIAETKPPPLHFETGFEVHSFLRGDLHAHSAISDGDSPAEVVISNYRDHDYQFFALTDHNRRLDIERYRHLETPGFVLIPGEEVTMAAKGLPIHVNALCTKQAIGGAHFDDRVAALNWAVSQINAQQGVALINHPNFHSALNVSHIASVKGAHLLEIYNGHPSVYSDGRAKRPAVEQMWDSLLSAGSTLSPAAVDDMHMLSDSQDGGVPHARPRTGWVEVFGDVPNAEAVCDGLRRGRLYASNGPELTGLALEASRMRLWLPNDSARVAFIGIGGEVLAEVTPDVLPSGGWHASYTLRGDESLVRARVTAPDGSRAWTAAYRTRR